MQPREGAASRSTNCRKLPVATKGSPRFGEPIEGPPHPGPMHSPFHVQNTAALAAKTRILAFALVLLASATKSVSVEEPTDAPAPTSDRVGFPKDYAKTFAVLRT